MCLGDVFFYQLWRFSSTGFGGGQDDVVGTVVSFRRCFTAMARKYFQYVRDNPFKQGSARFICRQFPLFLE